MNKNVQFIFAFSLGAAVGAVATWRIIKAKCERMINDEVDAFIEEYTGKKKVPATDAEPKTENVKEDSYISDYDTIIQTNGYDVDEKEKKKGKQPYVIPPESFGEKEEYDVESLNYYADGVLTDDWDNPIEDVERLVGTDFATHFGEYEDDCVFVRNDRLKSDFEILKDNRNFADLDREDNPLDVED